MTKRRPPRRLLRIAVATLGIGALVVVILLVLVFVALCGPNDRETELLVSALGIRPGETVGEIGAGNGWLSVEVARLVGPSGHVYSTELDADSLDDIRAAAREAGLSNVTAIEAAVASTNLAPNCCDAIFMRRVYHHLDDPAAIVADIDQALKPDGRLAIIEFESSRLARTITGEGIDSADLVAQVTAGKFVLVTVDDWPGPNHYVAVFRKQ